MPITVTTQVSMIVCCDGYKQLGYECSRNWQVEASSRAGCISQLSKVGWMVNAEDGKAICPDCTRKWIQHA